jgi:soluble P-type ATPase
MMTIEIPGERTARIEHLVFDVNGTLTARGVVLEGVGWRLERLSRELALHIATADTFGTADQLGVELGIAVERVTHGEAKAELVRRLGAERTVAIGNGRNDAPMLQAARFGIAVIGPEGAAGAAIMAADVVCRTIEDALDLLIEPRAIVATLRP